MAMGVLAGKYCRGNIIDKTLSNLEFRPGWRIWARGGCFPKSTESQLRPRCQSKRQPLLEGPVRRVLICPSPRVEGETGYVSAVASGGSAEQ